MTGECLSCLLTVLSASWMQTPLPTTFRITEGCPFTERLRAELQTFAGATVEVEGVTVHPCELLDW
eukprot:8744730-Pyramimonas_sp.AAC.1